MALVDDFMPTFSVRRVDRIAVRPPPELAWSLVRRLDVSRIALVRRLFDPGAHAVAAARETFAEFSGSHPGFFLLGEQGRELVTGAVLRLWKPRIEHARVTKDGFATFAEPGFGKVTWSLSMEPRENGESWVGSELRLSTAEERLPERLRPVLERVTQLLQRSLLESLSRELGRGRSEEDMPLAGDDFLAATRFQKTHAITIEAPPERVWPWLVQMGARRAGWYSFDVLDNGGLPSANRIVPELQHLHVGDRIATLPGSRRDFAVLRLEAPRALVLGSPALLSETAGAEQAPMRSTWAFVLEPIGEVATRLTVRVRGDYLLGTKMLALGPLMGVVHGIMEARQLRNLRRRAERASQRGDA
jgi:hypothetical protein